MPSDKINPDVRERLLSHFDVPLESHGKQWDQLYEDDFIPWDKGCASPALADWLETPQSKGLLRSAKRALVPGCGKGYDVVLFASHGLDAVGLDISQKAVEEARSWGSENPPSPSSPASTSAGSVDFVLGDFFGTHWPGGDEPFDVVYDYTFLCALPPEMRPRWAERMKELVKRDTGVLVCLEFPLYKELDSGGPPWGLRSEFYKELLEDAFERVAHWKPERTHEIGRGADWMSVWRRK